MYLLTSMYQNDNLGIFGFSPIYLLNRIQGFQGSHKLLVVCF
jgi:hypothetical protein